MKPAICLTDPKEMLRLRLNQPRATSEQLRRQREALRSAGRQLGLATADYLRERASAVPRP